MSLTNKTINITSLLPALVSTLLLFRGNFLMRSTLSDAASDIGVNLGVTLCTLKVDALLLGNLLEAGALPFWQPALVIGLGAWVLRVKVLWVLDSPLPLACGHENFCTALGFLDDVFSLLFFALLGHSIFDQSLHIVLIAFGLGNLWVRKLLLELDSLSEIS